MNETEPIIEDVTQTFKAEVKAKGMKFLIAILGSITWVVLILKFVGAGEGQFYLAFFPLGIVVIILAGIWNGILAKFYEQFAIRNGYDYRRNGTVKGTGALLEAGNSRDYFNIVRGRYLEHLITIFNYEYTIGSGKNRRTYRFTVFEIDYDKVLPNMFLRSDRHRWSTIKPKFQDGRRLDLEGNFDDYFDLFCEEKFEIEALQVFAPNIMEKLMKEWNNLNLEFVDDKIYIYQPKYISKKVDLEKMYAMGQYLIQTLPPVLARMESSVKAMQEQFKITS